MQVVFLNEAFCRMSVCVLLILGSLTAPGGHPGYLAHSLQNSIPFSDRFLEGVFFIVTLFVDDFLKDFHICPSLFRDLFLNVLLIFFSLFDFLLFWANPRRHVFYSRNTMVFAHPFFRKNMS